MRHRHPGPLVPPAEDGLLCELPGFTALPSHRCRRACPSRAGTCWALFPPLWLKPIIPIPTYPIRKVNAADSLASHDESCRIFAVPFHRLHLIGNAILCFLKFSTSAGALDPLPHLLTRKVLLHYLVSFTFSLFFQDFFFLGLKLCSQSFSPSSPQTTTKKTHFWSWFWLFLLPFFFYLLPRPSKIESINSFSLLIFPFTSRPTNVRLLPQMTLGVSRRALASDTVNFWAKSLLKIWRGRSKWMLSGWRNEHRKRASKGMTFTKWRVLIHARRGQVLQILVSLDNNGWLWILIEFCS